jgi:hypothetical protein
MKANGSLPTSSTSCVPKSCTVANPRSGAEVGAVPFLLFFGLNKNRKKKEKKKVREKRPKKPKDKMDEPGRVGGPLIRPLSYYLQSPSPQVHLQPPAEFASRGRFLHQPRVPSYNHNSTEKLLLEADLLFNELQSSSSPTSSRVLCTSLLSLPLL